VCVGGVGARAKQGSFGGGGLQKGGGADPKVHLKTGWQALHLALQLGHDSCVLMLLQEVSGWGVGRDVCSFVGGTFARAS
jgi:hypothetical protein